MRKTPLFAGATVIIAAWLASGAISQQPEAMEAQAQTSSPWYNCLTREVWIPEKRAWCEKLQTLQNIEYRLPSYGTIPLEAATYENREQRFRVVLVNQENLITFGDINGDGIEDAAILLGVNSGASGQFTYLVPVLNVVGEAQPLNAVFLGDRLQINALTLQNGQITLDMLTQGPNDPQSNPTMAVSRIYTLQTNASGVPTLVQSGGDATPDMPLPGPLPQNEVSGPTRNTIAFFEPSGYAVRVFEENHQLKINLYNQRTQALELSGAHISRQPNPEGTAYLYQGEFTAQVLVANDGTELLTINGELIGQDGDTNAGVAENVESVYTTLDLGDCEVLEIYEESGGFASRCEGYQNIPLYVSKGDLRFDVDVGIPNEEWTTANRPFNTIGDTVEWRIRDGEPIAAILRYNFDTGGVTSTKSSELAVFSIGQEGSPGCLVDWVTADTQPSQNVAARRLADQQAEGFDCSDNLATGEVQLPNTVIGTFDTTPAACSEPTTVSRLTISQDKLDFYYGYANLDRVAFRDGGYDVNATLFQLEGQVEVRPEAVEYRIEPNAQGDGIQFGASYVPESTPSPLVRCDEI